MKLWITEKRDRDEVLRIIQRFEISPLVAASLYVKGYRTENEILDYLCDQVDNDSFEDPFAIADMDKAVPRIISAMKNREAVCVYGDYDADGVTSTSVLYMYLSSLGMNVGYYIPSREKEGYGLNNAAIDKIHSSGVSLIITVDNGISAYDQVEYANSLGIDVIVTDHHKPPEKLPNALAIIDPHRLDDKSTFKHFSGVGVVFKLILGMEWSDLHIEEILDKYSAICAIGTIADVVSLTGENRLLVREGLKRLNNETGEGLTALIEASDLEKKEITAGEVGFVIAPRINAGGRMDLSQKSVDLLTTDDKAKAKQLSWALCDDNKRRKQIELDISTMVKRELDKNEDIRCQKVIVVSGENWHQGVIGLAASRIKEIYGKPTIVITSSGDYAKGSARSVEGFSMIDAVTYCKDLLTIFGGHPMAAGMSLATKNINAFRDKINEYADSLTNEFFSCIHITAWLKPGFVSPYDSASLDLMEPFGTDNERPTFAYGRVTISNIVPLKNGEFVRIFFTKEKLSNDAVYFKSTYSDFPFVVGDVVSIAVEMKPTEFMGVPRTSIMIREIKFAEDNYSEMLRSQRRYEEYVTGKPVTDEMRNDLLPTREEAAAVYVFFKHNEERLWAPDILRHRINFPNLSIGKMLVIIRALEDHELVTVQYHGNLFRVTLNNKPNRVDLFSAETLRGLMDDEFHDEYDDDYDDDYDDEEYEYIDDDEYEDDEKDNDLEYDENDISDIDSSDD